MTKECEQCGERNAEGALFCTSCGAYLAWEATSAYPVITETEPAPPTTAPPAAPVAEQGGPARQPPAAADRLRSSLSVGEVEVAPGGQPVSLDVSVRNQSDIVEGYVVDVGQAPDWLEAAGSEIRLMPATGGTLRLTLRIREGVLAVAQRTAIIVRVASRTSPDLAAMHPLVVSVAPTDRAVSLRVEPSVIRVKDQPNGEFRVFIDNGANNHPVHLELTGQDPERVMAVAFRVPALDVPAGQTTSVPARVDAPQPDPGTEISRQLTVSAFDGRRAAEALLTFTQRTSPPVTEPPIVLRLHPSVVQATDEATGWSQLEIDNSDSRQGARVSLSAFDAEGRVQFQFSPELVDVAPGAKARVDVRLAAPPPEPGGEAARPFTVVARYGERTVEATGTYRQRTSPSALSAMRLWVDPPVIRVRDRDRGRLRVIVDNRLGTRAARVSLAGRDREGTARLMISPPWLDVYPGQSASAEVEIRLRRPEPGTERTRDFTIIASEGPHEISAEAAFAQTSSDRLPVWRTVLTLLGAAAMVIGVFLPWTSNPKRTGTDWNLVALAGLFNKELTNPNATVVKLACAGSVVILLAVLAAWGRLGTKGRLTRLSALVCLLYIVAFVIVVTVKSDSSGPAAGAIVIILGCVSAYAGGQLGRR